MSKGLLAGSIGAALVVAATQLACGGRTADLGVDGGASSGSSGGSSGGSGGSGSSSGAFPFSGPSCSSATISNACWSCLQGSCPGISCLTSDCSAYFDCYCACPQGDANCAQNCQSDMTPACLSCAEGLGRCTSGCASECSTTGMGGGGGSSGGGGGFGSSSGGSGGFGSSSGGAGSGGSGGGGSSGSSGAPIMTTTCSGSAQPCPNGGYLQLCQDYTGSTCTDAYYRVNGSMFACVSCTDLSACSAAATMACQ
jgi:hypothetical protein